MFSTQPDRKSAPIAAETVLSTQIKLEGQLRSTSNIRFDGEMTGDLSTEGDLSIDQHGKVKGNVTGRNVVVAGTIEDVRSAGDPVHATRARRHRGWVSHHRRGWSLPGHECGSCRRSLRNHSQASGCRLSPGRRAPTGPGGPARPRVSPLEVKFPVDHGRGLVGSADAYSEGRTPAWRTVQRTENCTLTAPDANSSGWFGDGYVRSFLPAVRDVCRNIT